MKKYLLFVTAALNSLICYSQAPAIKFQKSLGGPGIDQAKAIQQTADGGFIIAGSTTSTGGDITINNGSIDYWVAKIDTAGTLVWQKSLGGSADDHASAIIQTSDGGYLVVGTSNSPVSGDITAVKGQYDVWIAKLTPSGTLTWQKTYGGTAQDEAYAVQQTADGGYVIVGDSRSNNYDLTVNNGLSDFWIIKTDGIGTIQWQKALGGSGDDIAYAVQQTTDGGYVVSGQSNSNNADVSGNNGGIDYWVVKLTSIGTVQWQKCLGGTGSDISSSIRQTSDGGYIVGGKTASNNGNVTGNNGAENAWIVKLSNTGAISWQKCFGGNGYDGCNSIQQTIDGGYIFTGAASSNTLDVSGNHGSYDYWVVKLTGAGTFTWQKCLGGSSADYGMSIQQTSDQGYVVGGSAASSGGDITNPKGLDDFWVVRFKGVVTSTVTTPTAILEADKELSQFMIYPNPGNGLISVSSKHPTGATFKITLSDPMGRVVYENKSIEEKFNFDVSQLVSKGIYFLSILKQDGSTIEVRKVLIE